MLTGISVSNPKFRLKTENHWLYMCVESEELFFMSKISGCLKYQWMTELENLDVHFASSLNFDTHLICDACLCRLICHLQAENYFYFYFFLFLLFGLRLLC